MIREGWNFHGDIAIELEGMGRSYYGWVDRPVTKIFDADSGSVQIGGVNV